MELWVRLRVRTTYLFPAPPKIHRYIVRLGFPIRWPKNLLPPNASIRFRSASDIFRVGLVLCLGLGITITNEPKILFAYRWVDVRQIRRCVGLN